MAPTEKAIRDLAAIMPVAVRKLTDRMALTIEKADLGITLSQLNLLEMLANNADPVQCVIAEQMGVDKSAILRQVDMLESKGWVERQVDKADRRRKRLVVSKLGKMVLDKALERRNVEFERMVAGVSEEELTICSRVLQQLSETECTAAPVV